MPSRVYVIELAPGAGRRRDPRLPWLYVGSSARDPETRFAQHLRGYKSAGIVKRHALRLRPDLYDDLPEFKGRGASKAALAAEHERARELAACGFVAHCDGTSHGHDRDSDRGAPVEWGPERLDAVADHFDDAVRELRDCCFRDPDPDELVGLLHGTRGFWVAELIDQSDPPPSWGLFAHYRRGTLASALAIPA